MLENNNKQACNTSTKSKKEYEKSIQLLITNEILRNENDLIDVASTDILNQDNFELVKEGILQDFN